MPSIGSGVRETRIMHEGEYRVIYVAKFAEAVYVLHAFQKKTQKTRKQVHRCSKAGAEAASK
jgi:phage-related protein